MTIKDKIECVQTTGDTLHETRISEKINHKERTAVVFRNTVARKGQKNSENSFRKLK